MQNKKVKTQCGECIIREDKNLLEQAKKVFGETLVENAYISISFFDWTTDKQIEEELKKEAYESPELNNETLDFDSKDIIITFNTGRSVCFSNSEWACMFTIEVD